MKKLFQPLVLFPVLFALTLPLSTFHTPTRSLPLFQEASPTPEVDPTPAPIPVPADLINAVNDLRLANGLNTLTLHPVLMDVAAQQASALALSDGAIGHERPCGMTLGQQLLSLGFPLWGDLSMDGYRSENWGMAFSVEGVIQAWLGDELHTNTMLSEFRSDIGAAIVTSASGQTFFVLETALRTNSGQHQSTAYDILTGIPMTQTLCSGFASGEISNYSIPVAVSTARPDGDVVHEVQYGQTLWRIADLYHVSVDDIKRMNGLVDDNILPGWKLLIQKAATQPSPPTATIFTNTPNPTPTLYSLPTRTLTSTATPGPEDDPAAFVQSLGQNKTVTAALIVSFAVLVAGMIGFGRRKE